MPPAFTSSQLLGALLSVASFSLLFGFFLWRWARRSADPPGVLTVKILVTLGGMGMGIWCGVSMHPMIGIPLAAVAGILVSILWAPNIGLSLAKPLASLYDGGDEETPPKPFYAIAEAHRKQGRFADAIAAIQEQLEKFPGDPEGLLLLAEIRARHLSDWTGAAVEIDQIVGNSGLAVTTRAKALQALADWHLDFAQNTEAAREIFQRIIDLYPDTPDAREAAQRLAHTGDGSWRREQKAPAVLKLPVGEQRLGLRTEAPAAPPEADPEIEATTLRNQLAAHPLDTEAREKLAVLYADKMGHLDWARGEIDKLLTQANHPPKSVARWLHLLADLEVRHGADEAAARAALQQIVKRFPETAIAATAQSRLERLRLEIKGTRRGETLSGALGKAGLDGPA